MKKVIMDRFIMVFTGPLWPSVGHYGHNGPVKAIIDRQSIVLAV